VRCVGATTLSRFCVRCDTVTDYKLVAPQKRVCSKGHPLTKQNERRYKHHTPYGRYLARTCRVCAREYNQARKAKLAALKLPRLTKKGVKPPREELAPLVGRVTWVQLGAQFGVSDVAVRNWAKGYGLV